SVGNGAIDRHPRATSAPQRDHGGAGPRADKGRDVSAHLGEGVAAQSPSLIEVIEPIEASALVADGEFGDAGLDAEAAHQRARGAGQVVRGEGDASGALQGGDRLPPAVEGARVFSEAKTSVLTVVGCAAMTARIRLVSGTSCFSPILVWVGGSTRRSD